MSRSEPIIFAEALELETQEERDVFLASACAGDPELRHRVESLLKSHEKLADTATFILDRPELVHNVLGANDTVTAEIGGTIGKYKLIRLLGEGGMGLVYQAEQTEPIRRKVALKLMRPGLDGERVSLRFEAERQALALLEHPGITKVLDAGTTETGRPYFVIEFVDGASITDYCDVQKVSLDDRLKLFLEVCRAIHHAHRRGIIHRDIKPSNVLVTMRDGRAAIKVIDFGIAKSLDHVLVEKPFFTRCGELVGTPSYMSPEQATAGERDIDVRTDVYSLGVLLYELLTGGPPLDPKMLSEQGIFRTLELIGKLEPEIPSRRTASRKDDPTGLEIAQNRRTDPAGLTRFLKGDLDWILMKALARERSERYDGVADLIRDIERWMAGEPVQAAPPSLVYKTCKFVVRYRVECLVAALILVILTASTIYSTWSAMNAYAARQQAEEARQLADSRLLETIEAKKAADEERDRAIKAEKQANKLARQRQFEEAVARGRAAYFQSNRGIVNYALPEEVSRLLDVDPKTKSLTIHVDEMSKTQRNESSPPTPKIRRQWIEPGNKSTIQEIPSSVVESIYVNLARNEIQMTDYILKEVRKEFDNNDPYVAVVRSRLGDLGICVGELKNAEALLRSALEAFERSPDRLDFSADRCKTMYRLAECLIRLDRTDEAKTLLERAHAGVEERKADIPKIQLRQLIEQDKKMTGLLSGSRK